MNHPDIRLGAIGLGGFARFALQHFVQVPGVSLTCVGGATSDEAKHCADRYGVPVLSDAEAVCLRDDVDWVYVNTPPFLHADQAEMALRHGKHVLVEKPLATTIDDGRRLHELAAQRGLRLVTNLMQRHNPTVAVIKQVLDERLLGEPLFFNFNNHAVDQGLPPKHWFWDEAKSGGIFIEHGVHFFDLARHWFGDGEIVSAGAHRRHDGCEDQVWCDAIHGDLVARFYHGFNQTSRTESQRWEIVCERGQMVSNGWIPMGLTAEAIVTEGQTRRLMELDRRATCRIVEQYSTEDRQIRGHGRLHDVFQKIQWRVEPPTCKSELYGDLLVGIMEQQVARKPSDAAAPAVADDNGGLASLAMAVEATRRSR